VAFTLPTPPDARPLVGRVAAATILLFWAAQFSILTAQRLMMTDDDVSYLMPRILVTAAGVALSFVIARLHLLARGHAIGKRMLVAGGVALVGALLHAAINFAIFHLFMPERTPTDTALRGYFFAVLQWFWAYIALSALLLSVVYAAELGERERRVAQLQRDAHAAHLRALRYQLNPHFMFNTLNSIASLVATKATGTAEQMVENLSDFLRAGLELDPNEDIPLAREIELQSLYLAIEAVRFPDRLRVSIDVPEALSGVLVPSLITQPLIENAVRHAVATSTTPVTLAISARAEGGRLQLVFANDRGDSGLRKLRAKGGTGVGLANVRERLQARYDDDCDFSAGASADGGFIVSFAIPLEPRAG
jgi:hypothetical protein